MVTGTPLDRHEDKETSGARYWTSTGRGSRQPGAQRPEAKPMPGLGRVGGRGRRRLFSGAQHLPPHIRRGPPWTDLGPVPNPTTRTVTNLLHDWVSKIGRASGRDR